MHSIRISRGRALPLGASALTVADGINFALLCRHGTTVSLVLYDLEGDEAFAEIPLDPYHHRTGDHWHILVGGLPTSFRYGWRVDGPLGSGHRFDPRIVLLDPAATAISDGAVWGKPIEEVPVRRRESVIRKTRVTMIRKRCEIIGESSVVAGGGSPDGQGVQAAGSDDEPPPARSSRRRSLFFRRSFNWHGDVPPLVPLEDSIIYELHVRGFTAHPSSAVAHPGTYQGIIDRIPYLKKLGVTAVELLPIHEFDENDCPFSNPQSGERHRNFWGYNSIAFAAPKAAYAASGREHGQVTEFREMVRALHAAGIEVILDVVFNHTGEGDHRGRSYSFRGLDNELYYLLDDHGRYLNYSGCGNTVNCNHPVVRDLIMTCLRYWVSEMHVDGLRFDLASILGRDRKGNVLLEPPVIETIAEDGVLADTKLIAEPWDAAGLYQVGTFPYGVRWSEWNGRYRDDVRRFWQGEPGMAGAVATRIAGSADLYEASGRQPRHSINFVTCHDGFTLYDLVSYNYKHNLANGENNRDGTNDNYSWNCGVEGETNDPAVLDLRRRQARNFMATLMLSQGVPMILAGDEFLRTQRGNNNAWCQDNEISWIDWTLADKNADFLRFVQEVIAMRKRHPVLRRRTFFRGRGPSARLPPDIIWHGTEPGCPDWSAGSRILAFCLDGSRTDREPDCDFYVAFNAWQNALDFRIPLSPTGRSWRQIIDTAKPPPLDIVAMRDGERVPPGAVYRLAPHSTVVLISEPSR
jgi:glycogen operon protein